MPRRVAALNARQVDNIKPGQELIDGAVPGLRVSLTAAGPSWGLSVRVRGVRRWIHVGAGIGLAEARKRALRLRQDIADGKDPSRERKAVRDRQKAASVGVGTLEAVLSAYFNHRSELRSAATQHEALTAVLRDYLAMPALDLTPALAQLAIDRWAKTRSRTLAARAVSYLKPLARWAARRGLMVRGFAELERPAQAPKAQPTLTNADLSTLLRSLADTPRDRAIRMMLSTGARCNEICGAIWREFDLERGQWTLPSSRRKNTKPGKILADHVMHLPAQLVAMLRQIGPGGPDALVFRNSRGAALADWPRWTRDVRRKISVDVTPHALRRTFATLLGELDVAPHVVSGALGHTIGGQLIAGYNKATYSDEVREAVDRLADRLNILENGGNVVALPRRA